MKIIELKAYPTSFPVPPEDSVTLGIGRAVKRDAVVVKVTTDDGVVCSGESHHGRAPGAVGDTLARDLERVAAVRKAFGDGLVILVDANTGYSVADARAAMPGLDAHGVGWLEEPFAAHDHRSYALAATFGRVPLAAGENHYTRFEFTRVIEDRVMTVLQPGLSTA